MIARAAFAQMRAPSRRRVWVGRWGLWMFLKISCFMLRCGNITATRRMLSWACGLCQ